MATLKQDIKKQSAWLVKAFAADQIRLDYSIDSLKLIDQFFDEHAEAGVPKPHGRLAQHWGPIVFSIGSYIGETIIRNAPGTIWKTNDQDPEGELNAAIHLPNGIDMWPIQRAIKRFKNGSEDGIYDYGVVAVRELIKDGYFKETQSINRTTSPWWKFWSKN